VIELRTHYPHSVWGRLKTVWHRWVKRCRCQEIVQPKGGVVVFDDSCRDAWWA